MAMIIKKASGETEPFFQDKIERSLKRIGTPDKFIREIIAGIERAPEITSTRDIYFYIAHYLKGVDRALASRYNLKNALYQLGPEGFLFEKFIAELFNAQQFRTKNDFVVKGNCVDHEIDVIACKGDDHFMVECKFHNSPGIKTDVKVSLYIKSRFEDVRHTLVAFECHNTTFNKPWLATNTKFTTDAIAYARCVDMGLVGWAYPEKTSIETTVDSLGLYPITCLVSLNYHQKKKLLEQDVLLCKELATDTKKLTNLGLSEQQARQVQEECKAISS